MILTLNVQELDWDLGSVGSGVSWRSGSYWCRESSGDLRCLPQKAQVTVKNCYCDICINFESTGKRCLPQKAHVRV